jgi:hypothetical protein
MISEVDINDVSISQSDEDINIDSKIKRNRKDDDIIYEAENKKGIILKKFFDENDIEYPLTGGETGYASVFFHDENSDELNEEE